MPNYNQTFTISEIAHILEVDRQQIKSWSSYFSEYLSPLANPSKGCIRIYNLNDMRIFAYVFMYWEDNPDIEDIKYGLDTKDHYDNSLIDNLITKYTSLFRNITDEEINHGWSSGVLIGGLIQLENIFELAESYRVAGDKLVDQALIEEIEYELICPIIYTYRHSTELYLKSVLEKNKKIEHHDLEKLYNRFKLFIKKEFGEVPPAWFEDIILVFHDFDGNGTTFRYGDEIKIEEIIVDLRHVKTKMNQLARIFQRIDLYKKGISSF